MRFLYRPCLIGLGDHSNSARTFFDRKISMYVILNEVYLRNFLGMDVIFRDESNDGN